VATSTINTGQANKPDNKTQPKKPNKKRSSAQQTTHNYKQNNKAHAAETHTPQQTATKKTQITKQHK
jgi:hypothetical protein